jgi:hypothetical protein
MISLGVACDGGKDSLSMAAAAGGETVMAPGNLVISAYVTVPDVTQVRAAGGRGAECWAGRWGAGVLSRQQRPCCSRRRRVPALTPPAPSPTRRW